MNKSKDVSFPRQGEIWLTEFPPAKESRKPIRPVLIISDNIQNEHDQWVVAIPFTTEDIKYIEPFEVLVSNLTENGLDKISKLQFNYPFTVDKERFKKKIGTTNKKIINQAKTAWKIAFDSENWDW